MTSRDDRVLANPPSTSATSAHIVDVIQLSRPLSYLQLYISVLDSFLSRYRSEKLLTAGDALTQPLPNCIAVIF